MFDPNNNHSRVRFQLNSISSRLDSFFFSFCIFCKCLFLRDVVRVFGRNDQINLKPVLRPLYLLNLFLLVYENQLMVVTRIFYLQLIHTYPFLFGSQKYFAVLLSSISFHNHCGKVFHLI